MQHSRTPRFHLETVDSTNLHAARLAKHGEHLPFWVTSDEQTAGRGRNDRRWVSEPGNLYASYSFSPECEAAQLPQLSLVTALAVYDTVANWVGAEKLKLKWPNDCLADEAKISGILIESLQNPSRAVVIGCGINIASKPSVAGYPTAALHDYDNSASAAQVFETLVDKFGTWLSLWKSGSKFPMIREEWLARGKCFGQKIAVRNGVERIDGICRGLSEDGALLLEQADGNTKPVFAGDVRFAA